MCKLTGILLLLLPVSILQAQPVPVQQIAGDIRRISLIINLNHLASDDMEGRLMASHGDTLASTFIADWFRDNEVVAPYENGKSYFQSIVAYRRHISDAKLVIGYHSFSLYDGWFEQGHIGIKAENATVLYAGYSEPDSLIKNLKDSSLQGKVLIIPFMTIVKAIGNTGSLEEFFKKLHTKGIVMVLTSIAGLDQMLTEMKKNSFQPSYVNPLEDFNTYGMPLVAITEDRMNELLLKNITDLKTLEDSFYKYPLQPPIELLQKINATQKISLDTVHAPNVIGIIQGTDTSAGCIVFSAHHDHLGRNGREIYYGAADNASGTAVLMQVAASMNNAVHAGFRPKRSIVLASFTGEEEGLLGSQYYVEHPVYPLKNTWAVFNIDMLGLVDSIHAGKTADSNYVYTIIVDSLNRGLRNSLFSANQYVKLTLDRRFENPGAIESFLFNSDNTPFFKAGVPFIRTFCGYTTDYHQPSDTSDKINFDLLREQTQLAFLTLWNLANN